MKKLFTIFVLVGLTISTSQAKIFTSATPGGLSPEEQGVCYYDNGRLYVGWFLDNWSAVTGGAHLGSPKLADLNGDGVDEILQPVYSGQLYGWTGAGLPLNGFPLTLNGTAPGTPAVGDIDNDGDMEIVMGTWSSLHIFNADGSPYPGWPVATYVDQAVSLADLDDDGDLELIVPSQQQMKVYHHNGASFAGFPVSVANRLCAASVGDIDRDGDLEIVSASFYPSGSNADSVYAWHHDGTRVNGFPVSTAGSVKAAPVIADLDRNGDMEIIADCWNSAGTDLLYVWSHTGVLEPGWPVSAAYIRLSSPSIADMDGDGDLEIIVGGWTTNPYGEVVHVYHHNGVEMNNFPVRLYQNPSGNVNSTPTVGDIDGDGHPEIVLKAVNNIYAINHDGSIVNGFPVFIDDQNHSGTTVGSPAIGDPDGDGLVEIFAVSAYSNVMLLDMSGTYSAADMSWPTYRNDRQNRGIYRRLFTPVLSLTLVPLNPPIVIPGGGGAFGYSASIENTTGGAVTFDAWTMVELPNGNMYGPLILRTGLSVPGGAVISRELSQTVPWNAPAGNYIYSGYAGLYPDSVIDSDQFGFVKLASEGSPMEYSTWSLSGWDELVTQVAPAEFALSGAYPNPFNPIAVIEFALPEAVKAELKVYNIEGREIAVLVDGLVPAGWHKVNFNGEGLASGIYFVKFSAPGFTEVKRMALMK